jgi:predicted ATPase
LGAPFQLQVKVRGPKANIVDVGYGVSQILPILVQILSPNVSRHEMSFSLLQQPEVHLHPKAQAEFSSLLARLANKGDRSFIVETHSDYMISRARIDIIGGNIRPEDVSLIYFEPKGNVVRVHNIGFDDMANLIGAPTNYRDFFLKESKRLMGFED